MYRLLFQGRESDRAPFLGREPQVVIGRDASCAVRLAEGGVSDRHAAIERRTDGYYLRDLDSSNGVRVNGQLITEQRLAADDEIEIGSVRLRFEVVQEAGPMRRTFDVLELAAGGLVALIITAQLGLFAWIFTSPRPERGTRIDTGKSPIQTRSSVIPQPDDPVAVPLPPQATAAVPAPVSNVLNRMLKIQRIDRSDGAESVTLKIQVKAQVGERQLDNSAVAVCAQFFAVGEAAPRPPVWFNAPADWENFSTKAFAAKFAGPPQQCAGYVVRTYYHKQLQDAAAAPPTLLTAAPAPIP